MMGFKKKLLCAFVWMLLSLLLLTACEGEDVSPNALFSSALDGEILLKTNGEEYRITLHLSQEIEGEERQGELIYLAPRGMEGIRVLSDGSGQRIRLNEVEVKTENESLLLPFFLLRSGEIAGKEMDGDEIVYRYQDGRQVCYSVSAERITRILYGNVECRIEWIEVRRGKEG